MLVDDTEGHLHVIRCIMKGIFGNIFNVIDEKKLKTLEFHFLFSKGYTRMLTKKT